MSVVIAKRQRAQWLGICRFSIAQRAQRVRNRFFCLRRRAQWLSSISKLSSIRFRRRASPVVLDNPALSPLTPLTVRGPAEARGAGGEGDIIP